jgi:hypothetical protein
MVIFYVIKMIYFFIQTNWLLTRIQKATRLAVDRDHALQHQFWSYGFHTWYNSFIKVLLHPQMTIWTLAL